MLKTIGQGCFALGPIVGYVPQWWLIRQTGTEGLSTKVCLMLLLSNITRVFFWFGKRFDSTLLYQALIMIIVQLLLLEALVNVKSKKRCNLGGPRREDTVWDTSKFWDWNDFSPYIQSLILYTGGLSALGVAFKGNTLYTDLLGAAAVTSESLIAVPQIIQNFKRKDTAGLSYVMVLGWLLGDAGKLLYYVFTAAPFQFFYGVVFQLLTDNFVLFQMAFSYRHPKHNFK